MTRVSLLDVIQRSATGGGRSVGLRTRSLYRTIRTGVTMERHELEALLTGDDEASVRALSTLRSGATYWVGDGAQPAAQHAEVFKLRLKRMRRRGLEPLGLERAVQLVSEQGRPVRTGMIHAADRTWVTLLFVTEDTTALVACAGWPLPLPPPPPLATREPLLEAGPSA
ncbi:hypothetical protein ACIPPS_29195 [Streptomyces sp. NPDC090127]|uniref:hypothetical protein n=1 Tax=Streptomyces sp. NPDC090127 TaxID=3365953 RepID=UPI003828AEC3